MTTWMHNGSVIGNYEQNATYEFTEQVTVKQMYDALGSALLKNEDYDRGIWIDGQIVDTTYITEEFKDAENNDYGFKTFAYDSTDMEDFAEIIVSGDTTPFLESGAGVLTQVYVIAPEYSTTTAGTRSLEHPGQIIISMIHTYLGEVTYVNGEDGDYEVGVSYYTKDPTSITQNALVDYDTFDVEFNSTKSYSKGDKIVINVAENAKGEMEIVNVYDPTLVSGQATGSQLEPDVVGGSWLEVDGEQFNYALSIRGNIDDDKAMVPVKQTDIEVYLDEYGYVLGYEAIVPAAQYLYVEETGSFNLNSSQARVTIETGEEKVITVSYIDNTAVTSTLWENMPQSSLYTTENNVTGSANENIKAGTVAGITEDDKTDTSKAGAQLIVNRIYGYEELSDGTYKLVTDIRDEFVYGDEDKDIGVLPGMGYNSGTGTYTYDFEADSNYTNVGGLGVHELNADAYGSLVHSPENDSMFVYTSVTHGVPATETDGVLYLESETAKTWLDDGVTTTVSANKSQYSFKIFSGHSYVQGAAADKTTEHVFAVDNKTVFVDVVGNTVWNGMSEVPNMEDGDLNMQVVFGSGGVADIVFINHGAPAMDTGDYFVVTDNEAVWRIVDGVDTYTYTVWINGVATEIVSKDNELKDSEGDKLNNNDLYYINKVDDAGYVHEVIRYYQLDKYAHEAYGLSGYGDLNTNEPMSAVSSVRDGVILMTRNEWFDDIDKDGDNPLFWDEANNGEAYDDVYHKDTNKDAIRTANGFTYNDSTNFVVLTSKGDSAWNSADKYSVRVGSVDDIRTISDNSTTWVDVVSADLKDDGSHPVAKTVLIINPKGESTGTDSYVPGLSDMVFHMNIHDTFNEPTYGVNWANSSEAGTWSEDRYRTDGTSNDKAYVLEGYVDTKGVNISKYSGEQIATEAMIQYAKSSNFASVEVTDLFGGNDKNGVDYGSWTAKLVGISNEGQELTQYITLTFHDDLDAWGNGVFLAGFSANSNYLFLDGEMTKDDAIKYGDDGPYITGSLALTTEIMDEFANEDILIEAIADYVAAQILADELQRVEDGDLTKVRFDQVFASYDYTNVADNSNTNLNDWLTSSYENVEFTYFKDGSEVTISGTGYSDNGIYASYNIDLVDNATENGFLLSMAGETEEEEAPEGKTLASITLSNSTGSLTVGDTLADLSLVVTAFYKDDSTGDVDVTGTEVTSGLTYTLNGATISASTPLTAVTAGALAVTYTDGNSDTATATFTLTVTAESGEVGASGLSDAIKTAAKAVEYDNGVWKIEAANANTFDMYYWNTIETPADASEDDIKAAEDLAFAAVYDMVCSYHPGKEPVIGTGYWTVNDGGKLYTYNFDDTTDLIVYDALVVAFNGNTGSDVGKTVIAACNNADTGATYGDVTATGFVNDGTALGSFAEGAVLVTDANNDFVAYGNASDNTTTGIGGKELVTGLVFADNINRIQLPTDGTKTYDDVQTVIANTGSDESTVPFELAEVTVAFNFATDADLLATSGTGTTADPAYSYAVKGKKVTMTVTADENIPALLSAADGKTVTDAGFEVTGTTVGDIKIDGSTAIGWADNSLTIQAAPENSTGTFAKNEQALWVPSFTVDLTLDGNTTTTVNLSDVFTPVKYANATAAAAAVAYIGTDNKIAFSVNDYTWSQSGTGLTLGAGTALAFNGTVGTTASDGGAFAITQTVKYGDTFQTGFAKMALSLVSDLNELKDATTNPITAVDIVYPDTLKDTTDAYLVKDDVVTIKLTLDRTWEGDNGKTFEDLNYDLTTTDVTTGNTTDLVVSCGLLDSSSGLYDAVNKADSATDPTITLAAGSLDRAKNFGNDPVLNITMTVKDVGTNMSIDGFTVSGLD